MSRKNSCVLLYPNDQDTRRAVEKLQTQNFNMKSVSIIGKCSTDEEHQFEKIATNEQMLFQGIHASLRKNLWSQLGGALFFSLSDTGSLITAGAIVNLLKHEQKGIDIGNSFTVLGLALFNMGIPGDCVKRYEKAVKTGKFLLTVNGNRGDVEQACHLLHNETQQATVHIA